MTLAHATKSGTLSAIQMSGDIPRRIRAVLDNTPVGSLTEVLIAIKEFVQQQQEATEWAILDRLTDELESIYKELVDHTSPANLETFVSILCAFLPVLRPVYVITCWWDLLLCAALQDPRLSAKATQQVMALTLHAIVSNSPKAAEFRKRVIEFYLDVYDESSGPDALKLASMVAEERQVWKQNLRDILEEFCMKRPEVCAMPRLIHYHTRLHLACLTGVLNRHKYILHVAPLAIKPFRFIGNCGPPISHIPSARVRRTSHLRLAPSFPHC